MSQMIGDNEVGTCQLLVNTPKQSAEGPDQTINHIAATDSIMPRMLTWPV